MLMHTLVLPTTWLGSSRKAHNVWQDTIRTHAKHGNVEEGNKTRRSVYLLPDLEQAALVELTNKLLY